VSRPIDISPSQLRAFLRGAGWEQIGAGAVGGSWMHPELADAPAILVPEHPDDRDFGDLLWSAVRRLAWTAGLPEGEVVERILSTSDVLEVRVVDPTTASGRISLERGAHLVESIRQLIWNGARVRFAGGRAGYRGGLPDAARAVVDQFELAPPVTGSFMLEVYAPAETQLTFDTGETLPASPVHETLVYTLRALAAARQTVENQIPEDADELEEAVARGVSTNLLNAMIRLDTQSPALRVEFRGRWSRPDPDAPDDVTLESHHFARFPELRDVIAQHDPRDDYFLTGWIRGFVADELATDEHPLSGVVLVEARVDETTRDVRLELQGDDLRAARGAAGEGLLTAVGRLEKIRRDWHLTNPRGVAIRAPLRPL
jgi:hypothetical protein